jgi:hypothetical protein
MDADVSKKIRTDFPQSAWAEVERALLKYDYAETDRVYFDILLLANGDITEVERLVERANQDYRDILYWAEYYDNDPWILWQRLIEHLTSAACLSPSQAQYFLDMKGAGFWREPSLEALRKLCDLLKNNSVRLTKDDFERIRAYGRRWKAKAC